MVGGSREEKGGVVEEIGRGGIGGGWMCSGSWQSMYNR